jgi:phosphate transport system substrate-binding protein
MKKGFTTAILVGMLSLAATVCLAAEVKVGGGGAACKGFFAPATESFEAETGIILKVMPSTPGQGLIELNAGHLDVATSAVTFEAMIKGAAKSGITIDPSQFTVNEIGTNKTLVFTHKSNPVQTLSKKQLQDIFTGKKTNWQQVGGADQEIAVAWGVATPGQNGLFTQQILEGKSIAQNHQELTDYKSIKAFIEKTPGAIGIDPQGYVSASTRNPKIPLITSTVIAVTKGKPSAEAEKLIQFVKEYAKD